jgi:GTP cyclohydrolase I
LQLNPGNLVNAPEKHLMVDVQASADHRNIAINRVGIKGLRHPIIFTDGNGPPCHTVATFDMYVGLPAEVKGTHMSRFIEIVERQAGAISVATLPGLFRTMLDRLEANTGHLALRFPFFIEKAAPVSGVRSLMDYEIELVVRSHGQEVLLTLAVKAPVTSLCPCSKAISAYGAHNQRSLITLSVGFDAGSPALGVAELIGIAESEASCEVYGLLKRVDEKHVTERAYDNPKFVEDLVRDIAAKLQGDPRFQSFAVESENFESIHNHSAYAVVEKNR